MRSVNILLQTVTWTKGRSYLIKYLIGAALKLELTYNEVLSVCDNLEAWRQTGPCGQRPQESSQDR